MSPLLTAVRLPLELVSFAVALLASLALTVPVRRLALQIGMVDLPGPRKLHLAPIPLLGGLAIYSGVLLAGLASLDVVVGSQVYAILAGATLLALVGILDDRGWLHHQVKLFVGMPVAALILLASGIRTHVLSFLWPDSPGVLLDSCLTVLWVVGMTAAFSILDHMDGLCAGVAAVASAFFTLFAMLNGQLLVSTLAAAVFGASLGFLRWNFNPAKIFMGDGGAMFLGFMLATLAIKLRPSAPAPVISWLIPVLVLVVPVFDTTLISVSRARRGLIPFTSPGTDHAAHRLASFGLGQRGAVLTLYALGTLGGLLALLVSRLPVRSALVVVGLLFLLAAAAILFLERAPFERQYRRPQG
ncbi:MAG: MraY family glycosyltransferase [Thermoanaerobaculia bacterium]